MNLTFDKIEITNFKAFVGKHTLKLNQPGLHSVKGRNEVSPRLSSNGASKSSLWDALLWCLYGRTVKGLRNPDIEPWYGATETKVTVIIYCDKQGNRVTRTTHPNDLRLNGKSVGQDVIDKLIGLDFDLASNTIVWGQGQQLFLDLTPSKKMELFAPTLNLDRWEKRSDRAADLARERQTRYDVMVGELTGYESQLNEIITLLSETKKKADEWQTEQQQKEKVAAAEEATIKKELHALQDQHDVANRDYDSAVTELRALQKGHIELLELRDKAKEIYDEEKTTIDAYALELRRLKDQYSDLGEADVCPTCKQPIKGTELHEHKIELKKVIGKLKVKVEAGVPKVARKSWEDLCDQVNSNRKHAEAFNNKAIAAKDILDATTPRIAELKAKLEVRRKQKVEQEEQINPHRSQIQQLRRRREKTTSLIRSHKDKLVEQEGRISRAKFWIKGFKDVQLYIIEDVLHELELTTNSLLGDMGLVGWGVSYSIEKETKKGTIQRGLNVAIKSPQNKDTVKWESWSGGEGQRLRLIGAMALSEVLLSHAGIVTNLEVLDEPSQHTSMSGVRDLVEVLSERAKRLEKSIFYVDHRVIESSHFDSVVTIVKDATGAHIEM